MFDQMHEKMQSMMRNAVHKTEVEGPSPHEVHYLVLDMFDWVNIIHEFSQIYSDGQGPFELNL